MPSGDITWPSSLFWFKISHKFCTIWLQSNVKSSNFCYKHHKRAIFEVHAQKICNFFYYLITFLLHCIHFGWPLCIRMHVLASSMQVSSSHWLCVSSFNSIHSLDINIEQYFNTTWWAACKLRTVLRKLTNINFLDAVPFFIPVALFVCNSNFIFQHQHVLPFPVCFRTLWPIPFWTAYFLYGGPLTWQGRI